MRETDFKQDNDDLFRTRMIILEQLNELTDADDPDSALTRRRIARTRRQLDDVTTAIIERNYGLVRSYTKKFTAKANREDAADFEASAVVGLMRAIETFDPDRGTFGQWAFKPIQREVLRAVREAEFKTMNTGDFERRPAIIRANNELSENGTRTPSFEEVAERSGMSVEHVRRVLDSPTVVSISAKFGESDDQLEIGDTLPSREVDPGDQLVVMSIVDALAKFGIPALDDRELFVLTRRMGLDNEPPQKLSAIGKELDLSREAVRQLESKALSRLQHPVILRQIIRAGRS